MHSGTAAGRGPPRAVFAGASDSHKDIDHLDSAAAGVEINEPRSRAQARDGDHHTAAAVCIHVDIDQYTPLLDQDPWSDHLAVDTQHLNWMLYSVS